MLTMNVFKRFKNESEFQTYMGKHFKDHGCVYYKLADSDRLSLKPCDCIVCNPAGQTMWIELKYTQSDTININKLEPQQLAYLTRVYENGGEAYVYIYSLKRLAYVIFDIKEFLNHANNAGSVNLFGEKLKDINYKTKKLKEKFDITKMKDNIPL